MQWNWTRPRLERRSHSQWEWRPKIERLEDRAVPTNLPPGFTESVFASGIGDAACLKFTPDRRAFVCQLHGDLRVVKPNGLVNATPFLHVDTNFDGEHGLLGVAFDPNFSTNRYVYVYYTTADAPIHNRVSRFTASAVNPDVAAPGSEVVLLELDNLNGLVHVGGDLEFGKDGKLYISTGEDGTAWNAQEGSTLHGKMLRINPDGSVPGDNPFVGVSGVRPEIYAFGVRNAYRFAVHPSKDLMYLNDVGSFEPNAREEVNRLWYGGNYGWPIYEGVSGDPDYTDPEVTYEHGTDPETGGFNCAVTGALFYGPGTRPFPRHYIGDYFYADLCANWIRRYDPNTSEVTVFASDTDSLTVDLAQDNKGNMYYVGLGGTIHRITYSPTPSPLPGPKLTNNELVATPTQLIVSQLNHRESVEATLTTLAALDVAKPDRQRTPVRVELHRDGAASPQLVDLIPQLTF